MDDFALVASAQLMQVLLSDLGTELGDATSRKAIKKISKTLVAIDSSIRTHFLCVEDWVETDVMRA